MRDIASIVLNQAEALDMAYIERWVRTLNLTAEWRAIQQRIAGI